MANTNGKIIDLENVYYLYEFHDLTIVHDANIAYNMSHVKFSQIYNDCIKFIKINWSKLLEMRKRFTLPNVSMKLMIILKMSGLKLNN